MYSGLAVHSPLFAQSSQLGDVSTQVVLVLEATISPLAFQSVMRVAFGSLECSCSRHDEESSEARTSSGAAAASPFGKMRHPPTADVAAMMKNANAIADAPPTFNP